MKLYAPSKIQRRLGEKLFLKPGRDMSPKSAMARRPYPPGAHGQRARRSASDYARALREKQKVRFTYALSDGVVRKYALAALAAKARDPAERLGELLELRLDSVLYRLGFARSRLEARQLIAYGHVSVGGRPARIPSRALRPGERVTIRESSRAQPFFQERAASLRNYAPPPWLELRSQDWEGKVLELPKLADLMTNLDLAKVLEYYSR